MLAISLSAFTQNVVGRYNGLLIDEFQSYTSISNSQNDEALSRGGNEDLPTEYSLEEFMPAIGDQGSYGSCVGWAVGYYGASTQWNFQNGYSSSSEKDVFSPWYVWNNNKEWSWTDSDAGTYYPKALNWVAKYGIKKNNETPGKSIDRDSIDLMPSNIIVEGWYEVFNRKTFYNCVASDSEVELDIENDFKTVLNQLSAVNDVRDESEVLTQIKNYISSGSPVLIGVSVSDDLTNYPNTIKPNPDSYRGYDIIEYEGDEPVGLNISTNYNCNIKGYHAMTIIAYYDDLLGGCFKVANSWGKEWGIDGFMYISYENFFKIADQAFVLGEIKVIDQKLLDKKVSDMSIAGPPKHGLVVEKYSNGKVMSETNYVRGLKSGSEKEYYKNGKLKSVSKYQDNILLEILKFTENQDTIDYIIAYENNNYQVRYNCMKRRNGNVYTYEMVKEKEENLNFYLDKDFVVKNKEGDLLMVGDFRGESSYAWDDSTTYYKWRFYKEGQLKHEFHVSVEFGEIAMEADFKTFNSAGEVKEKGYFNEGEKFGLYQVFENGAVIKEGTFNEDQPFGIWLEYDDKGSVLSKKVYGFDKTE